MTKAAGTGWTRFGERLGVVKDVLSIVGALVAAGWAYNEYLENKQDARVKLALDYRRQYVSGEIADFRRQLQRFLDRNEQAFVTAISVHRDDRGRIEAFYDDQLRRNDLILSIDEVLRYWDEVGACVGAELCDAPTVTRVLGSEAVNFANNWTPYVTLTRAAIGQDSFGGGLDCVAALARGADAAACSGTNTEH